MKKLLLISILCVLPFGTSFAASITEANCTAWETYTKTDGTGGKEGDYDKLGSLMQNVVKEQANLRTWTKDFNDKNIDLTVIPATFNADITSKCGTAKEAVEEGGVKERAYKNIGLLLENVLNEYNKIETQARMPFVHHGNILPGPEEGESGSDYVRTKFIPKYINGMLVFMISLSVVMIIVGGIMFIYSSGDSELTSRAKTTIMWSILGVIITILSYTIVRFIIGIDFTL